MTPVLLLVLLGAAPAADDPPVTASLHGEVKTVVSAFFPYDSQIMPAGPDGQGVVDGRLKAKVAYRELLELEVHHAVSAVTPTSPTQLEVQLDELRAQLSTAVQLGLLPPEAALFIPTVEDDGGPVSTGLATGAPEAVDLTWTGAEEGALFLQGRTDRLVLRAHLDPVQLAIGRQPVSFGNGNFFTPMDLVNPFTPTTIDASYKPGVDAFRADLNLGFATQISAVAAYAGSWDLPGLVFALHARTTVGVTDLMVLLGEVHGDHVAGLGVVSSIGPVGFFGDVTGTIPDPNVLQRDQEDPFVRAVVGAMQRPTATTTLSEEVYVQSFGADGDIDAMLEVAELDRVARGEVWLLHRWYGALSISQEIAPLVHASVGTIVGFDDPSALLTGSVAVSVSDQADLAIGLFHGLGKRPVDREASLPLPPELDLFSEALPTTYTTLPKSEFGLYPTVAYVKLAAYF